MMGDALTGPGGPLGGPHQPAAGQPQHHSLFGQLPGLPPHFHEHPLFGGAAPPQPPPPAERGAAGAGASGGAGAGLHPFGLAGFMGGMPPAVMHHIAHMAHAAAQPEPTYEQLLQLEDVKVTASDGALAGLKRGVWGGQEAVDIKTKECLVCQEDFELGDDLLTLRCEHTFHGKCVKKWLQEYSNKCPVCKESVT